MSGSEELMGGYIPDQRQKEVLERLEKELNKIDIDEIIKQALASEPRKDVSTMYLEAKMDEIEEHEKEVGNFQNSGKHFTKMYRTLQGHCGKLQTDLDAIDVAGRDDLREARKRALVLIEKVSKDLANKAHEDGMLCSGCEVKD